MLSNNSYSVESCEKSLICHLDEIRFVILLLLVLPNRNLCYLLSVVERFKFQVYLCAVLGRTKPVSDHVAFNTMPWIFFFPLGTRGLAFHINIRAQIYMLAENVSWICQFFETYS